MQPILDSIQIKVKAVIARFARRKAEEQAAGMAQEATGLVASARTFAREEPVRAGVLALLALGLGVLMLRSRGGRIARD